MRMRIISALCATFIISSLWVITASGQSDISVSDANATFSPSMYGAPSPQMESVLQRVAERVFGDYSNATVIATLVDAPTAMRTALGRVAPRIFQDYASASRTAELTFPKGLFNDQAAPQLVGTATTLPGNTANSVILRWQVNELAQSTLDYGTAPGSYSQTITTDSFETTNSVEVGNLTAGTTYYVASP